MLLSACVWACLVSLSSAYTSSLYACPAVSWCIPAHYCQEEKVAYNYDSFYNDLYYENSHYDDGPNYNDPRYDHDPSYYGPRYDDPTSEESSYDDPHYNDPYHEDSHYDDANTYGSQTQPSIMVSFLIFIKSFVMSYW